MKNYIRLNNLTGFAVATVAFFVYFFTAEPTASFWDCGEFIAAAVGLQVGHEPGAPFFLMLARLFSLVPGDPKQAAFAVNLLSVTASAATVLFLFWTITRLAGKLLPEQPEGTTISRQMGVLAAGTVGALAFTFSDTFWFSAVEAEVYALSMLFTAVVFWAILKWEASGNDKWLVLIAYLTGLSIGVHLLNLLSIPAIALVWYYRKTPKATLKGAFLALLAGCALLGLILFGVVHYLVRGAFYADLTLVNQFHLPFGSGAVVFLLLLAGSLAWFIRWSIRHSRVTLNLALNCFVFVLIGYCSYAMILVRANAKTAINISNPDNMYSLLRYISREQYGSTPLLYGNYFDAEVTGLSGSKTLYRKDGHAYANAGKDPDYLYDRTTLLPRIYSQRNNHPQAYRSWLGLAPDQKATFADNIRFMTSYQAGFMYLRYFLWNFAGKQNDEQGREKWRMETGSPASRRSTACASGTSRPCR